MKLILPVILLVLMCLVGTEASANNGYASGFSNGNRNFTSGNYLNRFGSRGSVNTSRGQYTTGFNDNGQNVVSSSRRSINTRVTFSNKHGRAFRERWQQRQEFLVAQEAALTMSQLQTIRTNSGGVAPRIYQGTQGNFARLAATRGAQKSAMSVVLQNRVVVPQ